MSLNQRTAHLEDQIKKMYEDKLEGRIEESFWKTMHNKKQEELLEIRAGLTETKELSKESYLMGVKFLKLFQRLPALYVTRNLEEKRKLLQIIISNSTLNDATLCVTYRKPFDLLAEGLTCQKWLHPRNINTKILCLEFFICDKKHPTEKRFLFPHELQSYQNRLFESIPRKERYIHPLKRALRYEQILRSNSNLNKSLLAKKLGTSRVRVTQVMGLLRLPTPLREKILKMRVSERTLRRLSQIRNPDALEKEFNLIFSQDMSQLSYL